MDNEQRTPKQWCEFAIQQMCFKLDHVPPGVEKRVDTDKLNVARAIASNLEVEMAKLPDELDPKTDLRMLGMAQSLLRWSQMEGI